MTTRIFCPGWYVTTIDGTEHYSRSMTAGVLWELQTRSEYFSERQSAARRRDNAASHTDPETPLR